MKMVNERTANRTQVNAERHVDVTNLDGVFGQKGIVILAPHPDDEILGCGALIAAMGSLSRPVWVIYLTDGGASLHQLSAEARSILVHLRKREALRGLAKLGLLRESAVFINAPDGHLGASAGCLHKAKAILQALIESGDISSVLVTSNTDGHVDHIAAYEFAIDALGSAPDVQLFAYPVSSRIDEGGVENPVDRFPILLATDAFRSLKWAALQCHRTQLVEDPYAPGFTLSSHQVELMCRGPEYFSKVERACERS